MVAKSSPELNWYGKAAHKPCSSPTFPVYTWYMKLNKMLIPMQCCLIGIDVLNIPQGLKTSQGVMCGYHNANTSHAHPYLWNQTTSDVKDWSPDHNTHRKLLQHCRWGEGAKTLVKCIQNYLSCVVSMKIEQCHIFHFSRRWHCQRKWRHLDQPVPPSVYAMRGKTYLRSSAKNINTMIFIHFFHNSSVERLRSWWNLSYSYSRSSNASCTLLS